MVEKIAAYGSWASPISAELLVSGSVGLVKVMVDGNDLYWTESRPVEKGRNVIVRRMPEGRNVDITPLPFNVRSRVHEYGGGAFAVYDGVIYFVNFGDQRLYRQEPGAEPRPITPEGELRYADFVRDGRRNRLIGVCEDHTGGDQEPVNTLVAIDLAGREAPQVLAAGYDFYAAPRLNADGTKLAWISWDHPNMPWDNSELWAAAVHADGSLGPAQRVAGGVTESVIQPLWGPDGALYFISDRTNWWNLYRWDGGEVEPLAPMAAEFGQPLWVFGESKYGFTSGGRIVCTYTAQGIWTLAILDPKAGTLQPVQLPYTFFDSLEVTEDAVYFIAAGPTRQTALIRLDLDRGTTEEIRAPEDRGIDSRYFSMPESIEFPSTEGQTAYALFYPPYNPDFKAPEGELPPLLVLSHGGPTAASYGILKLNIQYWTSRGIGVLDVNYGGSSGYGRAYRERLNGRWGEVDVDDCANGALYLAKQGRVDAARLIIQGGSAGGYTTLAALTFRDVFKAGACYYGIGDLEALARDTHKFESRYLDGLVGPYPECKDLYVARSPINFTERLNCPVIFFQGLEDRVVPPNQAETMVAALKAKGIPVAYLPFAEEGHGFRQAPNIRRSLEAELYFLGRVFGFKPADVIEPVDIENL